MKYEINSVEQLNLDLTKENPSALLVKGSAGSCSGVCYYNATEFLTIGVHDDQEGFYIVEGMGTAQLDEKEVKIRPDMALLLAPGVRHSFKRDPDSCPIKVFWFHAAP